MILTRDGGKSAGGIEQPSEEQHDRCWKPYCAHDFYQLATNSRDNNHAGSRERMQSERMQMEDTDIESTERMIRAPNLQ